MDATPQRRPPFQPRYDSMASGLPEAAGGTFAAGKARAGIGEPSLFYGNPARRSSCADVTPQAAGSSQRGEDRSAHGGYWPTRLPTFGGVARSTHSQKSCSANCFRLPQGETLPTGRAPGALPFSAAPRLGPEMIPAPRIAGGEGLSRDDQGVTAPEGERRNHPIPPSSYLVEAAGSYRIGAPCVSTPDSITSMLRPFWSAALSTLSLWAVSPKRKRRKSAALQKMSLSARRPPEETKKPPGLPASGDHRKYPVEDHRCPGYDGPMAFPLGLDRGLLP